MINESLLLERGVMNMDLRSVAVEALGAKHNMLVMPEFRPLYSFAQVVAAELLGCSPEEVTPEQIVVVESALQRRNWGGQYE